MMTKTEYLKQLQKYLKRLPKADYENAMGHFMEYFEDAGPDREQQVMEELGTPKEAASELLKNLLQKEYRLSDSKEQKKEKRHFAGRRIWITCLAVMAAPIAVPFALCILVLLFSGLLLLFSVALLIACVGFSAVLIGLKLLLRGAVAVPYSLSGAGIIAGMGMSGLGFGIFICIFSGFFCKKLGKMFPYAVRKILNIKKA